MDSLNFLEFHVASEITPGPTPKGRTHSQIAQENDQLQKDMIRNGYNNLPLDDTVSMESVNEVCLHPASENDKEEKQEQADRSLRQSSIATAQNNLQTINKILERLRLEDEDIQPFAVVEEVMPSSPAEEGGMMVGDRIIAIGSADASSVKRFGVSLVGDAVERMEGQELTLLISRVNRVTGRELRELPLKIVPRRWGGEGLLGARFVRLTP
ncbi:hypothetical protein GUITHDRAFT_151704 [Guillardia theta CCMP2712]|uniref:PDZ domain-containing protein n=1 Tax=Guillardia theta (strain CCMP2712) TaxID=905079 RepID=L1JK39_GUITC|nr:hypothetical protein GUITHDRAFT_151704 [Guillardia theta CCMP2712]EKX48841.1 hypothetical protein GUITHDRAFT_151704 [Guillardia theta CCMP2712]|eukprot:XP_005835821.1 hypothetical protein GUITHDRAFT_151704 [Guillardia theta CCMP2712]